MSREKLIRLGGPAALLGGLLFVVYALGNTLVYASAPEFADGSGGHAVYHVFNAPPNALMLLGVVGLYLYMRGRGGFGIVGKVGFYICATVFALTAIGGLAIIVSETTLGGAGVPMLDIIHPMVLLLLLGTAPFGVGALRSGSLPRGGAVVLIAVPVLMVASLFALGGPQWAFVGGMSLLGVGWAWLGYGLSPRQEETLRPEPAVG